MPFVEIGRMERRVEMMTMYDTGALSVRALCAGFGVSRETFYYWRRRREAGEEAWWMDRSRAPERCARATPAAIREAVLAMRRRYPSFGARKILARLELVRPSTEWPAASTIGDLLKQAGLVRPRRRRRAAAAVAELAAVAEAANEEWAIDLKGWFRTADGERCDPLTVSDLASRYVLAIEAVAPRHDAIRGVLERVFAEVGLPRTIRSDNGPPFGSAGVGGLSRLSVWWLRLGIEPRYGRPGHPEDNGRHERMHRTLKAETSRPPAPSVRAQQARFDRFRRRFNEERPHEALGQKTPATRWEASPRRYTERPPEPWYDADHQVRRVRWNGEIKWRGGTVFVGEALAGELVGVAASDRGGDIVRFCGRDLGLIDPARGLLRFAPPRLPPRRHYAAQPPRPDKLSGMSPV